MVEQPDDISLPNFGVILPVVRIEEASRFPSFKYRVSSFKFMEETMGEAFYLEVGCEEIPAGYISPALEAMALEMGRFLDENRIGHGQPFTTGTPRRLVLLIPDLALHQETCSTEVIGPPRQVAYAADGKPTKAAEGFARGQGVPIEALQIKETPRGAYLCIVKEEAGLPSKTLTREDAAGFHRPHSVPQIHALGEPQRYLRPPHPLTGGASG